MSDLTTPSHDALEQTVALPPLPLPSVLQTPADDDDDALAEAAQAFQQLQMLAQSGRFQDAADLCVEIVRHLRENADDQAALARFFTAYAQFMEYGLRATIQLRLSAVREALIFFQKAQYVGREILLPLVRENDDEEGAHATIALEVDIIDGNALAATVLADLKDEEFASAERKAAEAAAIFEAIAQRAAGLPIEDGLKRVYVASNKFQAANLAVTAEFARAELARTMRHWDAALDGYRRVEQGTVQLGLHALTVGTPVASDAQTALMNSTLVPIARMRLKENRALVEEGEHKVAAAMRDAASLTRETTAWKAALEALKQWSPKIDVQNNVDVQTTVSTLVQVTQVARQRAIEDLDRLEAAVKTAPIDEAKKAEVSAKVAELKTSKDSDSGFFQKLAGFAETAGKLLKGVESTLEPLGKIIAWVAPMAGAAMALAGG